MTDTIMLILQIIRSTLIQCIRRTIQMSLDDDLVKKVGAITNELQATRSAFTQDGMVKDCAINLDHIQTLSKGTIGYTIRLTKPSWASIPRKIHDIGKAIQDEQRIGV
jgi:hypothetical protein